MGQLPESGSRRSRNGAANPGYPCSDTPDEESSEHTQGQGTGTPQQGQRFPTPPPQPFGTLTLPAQVIPLTTHHCPEGYGQQRAAANNGVSTPILRGRRISTIPVRLAFVVTYCRHGLSLVTVALDSCTYSTATPFLLPHPRSRMRFRSLQPTIHRHPIPNSTIPLHTYNPACSLPHAPIHLPHFCVLFLPSPLSSSGFVVLFYVYSLKS